MSTTPAINQHWPEQGGIFTGSRISAGRGTAVKTEVLWLNAACQQRLAAPPAVQQALEI